MRCEECGRFIDNAEMWRIGGDPHAPTARSMLLMCWDCRARYQPSQQQSVQPANVTLSPTVIADVTAAANEASRTVEPGAA